MTPRQPLDRSGLQSRPTSSKTSQGSLRAHRGRVQAGGGEHDGPGGHEVRGDGERAFLVGVEFRSEQQRRQGSAGSGTTPQARLASQGARESKSDVGETGDVASYFSTERLGAEET